MNKKNLTLLAIIIIAILAIAVIAIKQNRAINQETTKQELVLKFQLLKSQYDQAKTQGLDISEVEKTWKQAKQAYDAGNYVKAKMLFEKATFALKNIDKNISYTPTPNLNSTPDVLKNPCAEASSVDEDSCEKLNSWLDKKLVEWKPAEYKPMDFAAYHTLASFPNVINVDLDLLQKYTAGLEETGADTITIYMHGTPFLKNDSKTISKWDAVVAKIKSDGKKLHIAYIPDVKGSGLTDWASYKSVEMSAVKEIMKKYASDSIVVLNEPSTIERDLSFKPTTEQWTELVNDSANLVKISNPKIKVNIQITGGDLLYFDSLISVRNIDGVGFNIYGVRSFETFASYIASVKKAGKEPLISETWKMFKDNQKYDEMDSLDAKWIRVAAYYAQRNSMISINPFFTFYFFIFPAEIRNHSSFLDKLESNIEYGSRTESFREYNLIIEEIKNNTR